jgi:alkyldihydroxyacetonephosphate synthase
MVSRKKDFYPDFIETPPREGSFRSIFKWGDPAFFKHPNPGLYRFLRDTFNLSDDDFTRKEFTGDEKIPECAPSSLKVSEIDELVSIVGEENVLVDDFSRARIAYGKTMFDIMRLRHGILENIPDAVIEPRDREDVIKLVDFCSRRKIRCFVYGGGSGVTRGSECIGGGILLDTRIHMNRILELDPVNQTVKVEPGIYGPDLEKQLQNARKLFNTPYDYTCGHFPQSFEYSVVGGWVVTRGAGQNSTYYGKIEDIVLSQEYVTPRCIIQTQDIPRKATGPDIDQIMMGSEGAFGILTSVTLKLCRHQPGSRKKFSFFFKNWEDAQKACREVMQGEFGKPSVFRLSDPEETHVIMNHYGISSGGAVNGILSGLGYRPLKRCLLLGFTDGDPAAGRVIKHRIKSICRKHGALYTTGLITRKWEHGRFTDAYLREDLGDFGIVLDTLECAVNWKNLDRVHRGVREYIHSRPDTICMTHISHFYPQGCNLYFIFVAKMNDVEEFKTFHAGILDAFQKYGAAMSHHHGIGKLFAPWLEGQIGKNEHDIIAALKRHFDPDNLMNPGGTLGLDLEENQKKFNR